MTNRVDTAFDRTFSEPPNVVVASNRTHCEACKEELDPNVMHKCHGNQEYVAPVPSHTEITEACPSCAAAAALIKSGPAGAWVIHVVICQSCRLYVYPPVEDAKDAIFNWNRIAALGKDSEPSWAQWRAAMPDDDKRLVTLPQELSSIRVTLPAHPDLSGYTGVCPECHGKKSEPDSQDEPCKICGGTGVIE